MIRLVVWVLSLLFPYKGPRGVVNAEFHDLEWAALKEKEFRSQNGDSINIDGRYNNTK